MIANRVDISERPEHINDKSEFGHWEGDSIVCSQSVESLNVMVERQTQYVSIRRVLNREPEADERDDHKVAKSIQKGWTKKYYPR